MRKHKKIIPPKPQQQKNKSVFMIKTGKFNINNMYVPESEDKSKGIYRYGVKNNLPNNLLKWVLDSGAAKKSQSKRARYISADGFVDEATAKLQVNKHQTADGLLAELAGYVAYFKGCCLWVWRDASFRVTAVKCLPLQDVRKRLDGDYLYNSSYSADKYDKTKDKIIKRFDPSRSTPEQFNEIKDNGELLYVYTKTADNPHYPVPDYYAGIEDIRTSSEIQKFDYETVMNGFVASAVLTVIGDLDDITKDEEGYTDRDRFEMELEMFTGAGKNSEGVSGRNKLLIITARTKEEAPILQEFNSKAIFEASNSKRDIVERAVCRWFGVNPVLVGYADAQVLGNQQALANASDELNRDVMDEQRMISDALKVLYPNNDFTISSFRPIQYVPDILLNELTPEEKRALIGYKPLPQTEGGNEKLLAERLGVVGTTSLTTVLADPLILKPQKVQIMKILFGLSDTDANLLVYGTETAPATETGAAA